MTAAMAQMRSWPHAVAAAPLGSTNRAIQAKAKHELFPPAAYRQTRSGRTIAADHPSGTEQVSREVNARVGDGHRGTGPGCEVGRLHGRIAGLSTWVDSGRFRHVLPDLAEVARVTGALAPPDGARCGRDGDALPDRAPLVCTPGAAASPPSS